MVERQRQRSKYIARLDDPVFMHGITRSWDKRQTHSIQLTAVMLLFLCHLMHVILILVLSRQGRSIVRMFLPQLR